MIQRLKQRERFEVLGVHHQTPSSSAAHGGHVAPPQVIIRPRHQVTKWNTDTQEVTGNERTETEFCKKKVQMRHDET